VPLWKTKSYDRIIGIDPGVHTVIAWCDQNDTVLSVSGAHYRQRAKFKEQKVWEQQMRNSYPAYVQVIQNMPSMKTSNLETMRAALTYRLEWFDYLFQVSAHVPFLKWRFTTFVYSQKALDWMARQVAPKGQSTLVGLGDWSQVDGVVRGHPKAPAKRLEKALKRVATVVSVREYLTSKTCSKCKQCKQHLHDVKVGNVSYPSLVPGEEGHFVSCHYVLRCLNPECNTFWNRDVNASRNILEAFICDYEGRERPAHLKEPD